MRGRFFRIVASCAIAGALSPSLARAADPFAGDYDGDALSVHIEPSAGGYGGEIRKGKETFPLKAHVNGRNLIGTFSTPDGDFAFAAALSENNLTLSSGGTSYAMKKHIAAENPLHAVSADKPSAQAAPKAADAPNAPTGYTLINTTDFGKSLTVEKPDANTIIAAFQSTFPDLAHYFDARPSIVGVFEDSKNHRTGGASFTAKLQGQPINGFVSCKLGAKGATLAVVYCRADAPKTEWNRLIAKPADDPKDHAPTLAEIKLRDYQFPDGTGTVGVADGWQTQSPSLMNGVVIKGPADQEIDLAFSTSISTPDSPMVQMHNQMIANARQFGMPLPPPLPITAMIAPYSDPEQSIKDLSPQISRISQAAGGPAISLDKIISVQKVNAQLPNGQAALITFDMTKTFRGVSTHYRSAVRWDMCSLGQGAWMLATSQATAPVETYERDLPAMLAMAVSLKENPQVVMEKARINIEAANERFAASQRANRELQQAFDAQNRAWERRSNIQSRSFADFDETIIGYRTVEDTTTGARHSVDLGNVHDVVDHLNEFAPGRYKEIPLRDEMYPLPAGR